MTYTKVLVIGLIIMTVLFVATVLMLMRDGMEEPETLIKYWFQGFISELIACAGIKVTKVVKENRKDDSEEEEPVG